MAHPPLANTEVAGFADELLSDGTAASAEQAGWMTSILLDQGLSLEAKLTLIAIARDKEFDFDPERITSADVARACESVDNAFSAIALFIAEPAGSA